MHLIKHRDWPKRTLAGTGRQTDQRYATGITSRKNLSTCCKT